MPELFEIKSRISGIKNIYNITYAMQIVTISRLKRIKDAMHQNQVSLDDISYSLRYLLSEKEEFYTSFFNPEVKSTKAPLLVLFFSNRGFCGSFNLEILDKAKAYCRDNGLSFKKIKKICVGKKAREVVKAGSEDASFRFFEPKKDTFSFEDGVQLEAILKEYLAQKRKIFFVYFYYKSVVTQHVRIEQVFPPDPESVCHGMTLKVGRPHFTDPSFLHVQQQIQDQHFYLKMLQAIRHSSTSEFSQRFLLMKKAVENVKELEEELTLKLNKERQRMITQEISEIISTFKSIQKDG